MMLSKSCQGRALAARRNCIAVVPARLTPCKAAGAARDLISRHSRNVCSQQRSLIIAQGAIEQITQEQLEVVIADREKPIIVDFFATWCGPCVMLAKELEKVAADMGDAVKIVKVDVDSNQDLASQLQISGLPTMIFIGTDRTKPALRTEGLLPADTIKDIVSKEL